MNKNYKNMRLLDAMLIEAVYLNDIKKINELVNLGANINIADGRGDTPLSIASELGYKDIIAYIKLLNTKEVLRKTNLLNKSN